MKKEHETVDAILSSQVDIGTTEPLMMEAPLHAEKVKRLLRKLTNPVLVAFTG